VPDIEVAKERKLRAWTPVPAIRGNSRFQPTAQGAALYYALMRMYATALALLMLSLLIGCTLQKTPYQRFVPMPRQPENVQGVPWFGAFALDTKTGQLCLTGAGDFGEDLKFPSCFRLYKTDPD
jgi:hypothetical protein